MFIHISVHIFDLLEYKEIKPKPKIKTKSGTQLPISFGSEMNKFMRITRSMVGPEWYEFGIQLGVTKDVLDSIKASYPDDDYLAKYEMLKAYISIDYENISLDTLDSKKENLRSKWAMC